MAKRSPKQVAAESHDAAAQRARAEDLRGLIGQLSRGEHPPGGVPQTPREITDAAARAAAAKAAGEPTKSVRKRPAK